MTQIVSDDGALIPITLVLAGPAIITDLKTIDTNGYSALQLGFGEAKKPNKAQQGHAKKHKLNMVPADYREVRINKSDEESSSIGDSFDVSVFEAGDKVAVTGTSKGKGFAGTVKRHNFNTSAKSHGGKGVVRKGGSIGSMYPQKVFKGRKMPGQMGAKQVTTKGLTIALVDLENNLLGIKGAIPGPRKSTVMVKGV